MRLSFKQETVRYSWKRTVLRVVTLLVLIALIPAAYFLPRILITGNAAESYCRNVFPVISILPISISSIFLISLTEMFVVVGSISLAALIIFFIVRCITIAFKAGIRRMLYHAYLVLRTVAVIAVIAALIFQLMHGINYNRESIRKQMHLYGDPRPFEDYEEALGWAYAGMVEARSLLGEDYHGVAHMDSSFETIVYDANIAVTSFSVNHDLGLSLNYVRAKPVMLSHLWRYTDIVGVYDPFLGEANINTDYIDILHLPVTVCHEICHAKGFASETDANTIAVLSCINSERADFRYAGFYYIFMRLWSEAGEYARYEGQTLPDFASLESFAPVLRDMRAYNRYLDGFEEGPIADFIARFSEDANNAFLESNGQEGGTDTYIVPQDAYVEYYFRFIRSDA